jgi:hypothetical protein
VARSLAQVHCMTQQWRRRIDFAMDTNGSARDQTALVGYEGDDYRMHAKHRAMQRAGYLRIRADVGNAICDRRQRSDF